MKIVTERERTRWETERERVRCRFRKPAAGFVHWPQSKQVSSFVSMQGHQNTQTDGSLCSTEAKNERFRNEVATFAAIIIADNLRQNNPTMGVV